jgi:hypothetical protein
MAVSWGQPCHPTKAKIVYLMSFIERILTIIVWATGSDYIKLYPHLDLESF